MTPWLRTLRAAGLVGVLGVGALLSPCGTGPAHGAGSAVVGAAVEPAPPVPDAASGRAPEPDGSEGHDGSEGDGTGGEGARDDGSGGQARPPGQNGHDGPGGPDAGAADDDTEEARPAGRPTSGPAGSAARESASPSPSSSASDAASATAEPSRAGSRPGEGRQRPGRPAEPEPERDDADGSARHRVEDEGGGPADEAAVAVPSGEATPASSAAPSRGRAGTHTEQAARGVPQVLPLGTGLVLVGLGLALAFVGLRLRRG
ncbi:hypothetical protein NGM36_11400 [Streptomyces mutabilis]|uniref:hypothetical protein n=1 Tax=Streptomyces mutabilis TaxID=67332 RepID=UPI0022BA1950|nr:hypothetical protein [Streptomyces mutabilis]MCZ9350389.1 hypothetical protein [Streptomyces mutabilis]